MKNLLYSALIIILILPACESEDTTGCPDKTCNDYTTQAQAQAAYEDDPDCLGELDNDNDGIACEHLTTGSGGTSGCPTTSNCGCSNKKKAECSGPCCQWIVGKGCRCN